jgi:hypothetical protein
MTTIVTRAAKGSALTWTEADANFTNLNTAKFEVGVAVPGGTAKAIPYLSASNFMSLSSTFVLDNGNLGVGTNSPGAYRLAIVGSQFTNLIVESTQAASYLQLKSSAGSAFISTPAADAVGFHTGSGATERMRIQPDGNVGIGTVSASSKLDVVGVDGNSITFRTSTRAISIGQLGGEPTISWGSGTPLRFFAGAERMRVHASGGMSLGNTTDPGATNLSVTGVVTTGNGAVGTPSHTFAGDLNTGMYWIAADTLGFATGGVERARFTTSGNFGIGVSSVNARLHVAAVNSDAMQNVARFQCANIAATDTHYLDVSVDAVGNIVQLASTGTNGGGFTFLTGVTTRLSIESGGNTRPGADNVSSIGTASFRWTQVFAATGTINTSDERDKVWRGSINEAERDAARAIIAELGFYQWADAVAEKGAEHARMHFGVRAQRVWAIMAEHSLIDPIGSDGRPGDTPYAFLCYDEWDDYFENVPLKPNEDGEVDPEAIPERLLVRAAGSRYGLRLDQMTLFLLAGIMPT